MVQRLINQSEEQTSYVLRVQIGVKTLADVRIFYFRTTMTKNTIMSLLYVCVVHAFTVFQCFLMNFQ